MIRYTINDVRRAFDDLRELAISMKLDVNGWGIGQGSPTVKHAWTISYRIGGQATLTTTKIGMTAREAYNAIKSMKLGMMLAASATDVWPAATDSTGRYDLSHAVIRADGSEVRPGDVVHSFRGEPAIFRRLTRVPGDGTATTGKIVVDEPDWTGAERYASVYDLRVVER